jgi:hypothetical protein
MHINIAEADSPTDVLMHVSLRTMKSGNGSVVIDDNRDGGGWGKNKKRMDCVLVSDGAVHILALQFQCDGIAIFIDNSVVFFFSCIYVPKLRSVLLATLCGASECRAWVANGVLYDARVLCMEEEVPWLFKHEAEVKIQRTTRIFLVRPMSLANMGSGSAAGSGAGSGSGPSGLKGEVLTEGGGIIMNEMLKPFSGRVMGQKIQEKKRVVEWIVDFSSYKALEIFMCAWGCVSLRKSLIQDITGLVFAYCRAEVKSRTRVRPWKGART